MSLTSLNSVAHCALLSAGGATLRNCDELCMKNGFTAPTHGVGSRAVGVSGTHFPTPVLPSHWDGPKRPSPTLESSMALAAACPIEMPWLLEAPSPMAASEVSRSLARAVSSAARPANGALSGAVETRFERTSYAAVATAASTEAFAPVRFLSR